MMFQRLADWLRRFNPEERRARSLVNEADTHIRKAEQSVQQQKDESSRARVRVNLMYDAIMCDASSERERE